MANFKTRLSETFDLAQKKINKTAENGAPRRSGQSE